MLPRISFPHNNSEQREFAMLSINKMGRNTIILLIVLGEWMVLVGKIDVIHVKLETQQNKCIFIVSYRHIPTLTLTRVNSKTYTNDNNPSILCIMYRCYSPCSEYGASIVINSCILLFNLLAANQIFDREICAFLWWMHFFGNCFNFINNQ